MHVITLNGKPVTARMIGMILKFVIPYAKTYIIASDAKAAKRQYVNWFGADWKTRHKGIECRRLKPEDVI